MGAKPRKIRETGLLQFHVTITVTIWNCYKKLLQKLQLVTIIVTLENRINTVLIILCNNVTIIFYRVYK